MLDRYYIKKDDKVKVIAGKDKGKIGKVLKVVKKDERILVENVNKIKRHMKPNAKNRQGGIVELEAPVAISNVMLVCGKCLKASRIRNKMLEDGKKVRICAKCGEAIDNK